MVILPCPYIEGGYRTGMFNIRGSVGYIFAYAEGRIELAAGLANIKETYVDFYITAGMNSVIQAGIGYIYGLRSDIYGNDLEDHFRIELGFFKPHNSDKTKIMPRIGYGWRFL